MIPKVAKMRTPTSRAFRPTLTDMLEERVVLSRPLPSLARLGMAALARPAVRAAVHPAQPHVPPPTGVAPGPMVFDPSLTVRTVSIGLTPPISMAFLRPHDILVLEKNTGRVERIVKGANLGSVLDLP